MKVQRQISLEILRILCMLFIITGHVGGRSGIESFSSFATIAPHAVNCFVLISGYFLINSKFKAERFLRTAIETIFYTFIVTIILYACNKANVYDIAKSFSKGLLMGARGNSGVILSQFFRGLFVGIQITYIL